RRRNDCSEHCRHWRVDSGAYKPHYLTVMRELSSKLQAPSSREAPNPKPQHASAHASGSVRMRFGIWSLVLLWSLELGIWSFPVCAAEDNIVEKVNQLEQQGQ